MAEYELRRPRTRSTAGSIAGSRAGSAADDELFRIPSDFDDSEVVDDPTLGFLQKSMAEPHAAYLKKELARRNTLKPKKGHLVTKGKGVAFTEAELLELQASEERVPRHLFRTYQLGGHHRSTGFSGPSVYLPASHCRKTDRRVTIDQLTKEDASLLLQMHLRWRNRMEDEYLSWTSSLLFLCSHAILRHEKSAKDLYVVFGDTRKLEKPSGERATFYPATSLMECLPDMGFQATSTMPKKRLHHRHFTHESTSFGEIRDPADAMIHVPFETLVSHGLFGLLPDIYIEDLSKERTGLYEHFVKLKQNIFGLNAKTNEIKPLQLKVCRLLAALFKSPTDEKAPFWAFVKFLSLRKRPKENPAFRKWVVRYYTAADIEAGKYADMHKVPNNLPDVEQAIKLAREAAVALGMSPEVIPDTRLQIGAPDRTYNGEDEKAEAQLSYSRFCDVTELLVNHDMRGPDGVVKRRAWVQGMNDVTKLMALSDFVDHDRRDLSLDLHRFLIDALPGEVDAQQAVSTDRGTKAVETSGDAALDYVNSLGAKIVNTSESEDNHEGLDQQEDEASVEQNQELEIPQVSRGHEPPINVGESDNEQNDGDADESEGSNDDGIEGFTIEDGERADEESGSQDSDGEEEGGEASDGEGDYGREDGPRERGDGDGSDGSDNEAEQARPITRGKEVTIGEARDKFGRMLTRLDTRLSIREASRERLSGIHKKWLIFIDGKVKERKERRAQAEERRAQAEELEEGA